MLNAILSVCLSVHHTNDIVMSPSVSVFKKRLCHINSDSFLTI